MVSVSEKTALPEFTKQLHNRFFVMRHGESGANVAKKIISDPLVGADRYGLTDGGLAQTRESVEGAATKYTLSHHALIFSSDFRRCVDTAGVLRGMLNTEMVHIRTELRERFFGEFEGAHNSLYGRVWTHDRQKPSDAYRGAEPVMEVARRTVLLVNKLNRAYIHRDIILVSHGDPLQILLTLAQRKSPADHRDIAQLHLAEIRPLMDA